MDSLLQYGWNDFFKKYDILHTNPDFKIGRVISVRGFKYHLMTVSGEWDGELSGKLLYIAAGDLIPKVGDWVYYLPFESMAYIHEVFPRINVLSRKNPGNTSEIQVLAANIDKALVVQGLDRDFNLMRLDRYLVQILAAGIDPVVIMNKADLVTDTSVYLKEINRLGKNCPVYFCSSYTQSSIQELFEKVLLPAQTHILIGSSGVGKSTLMNTLTGRAIRPTGAVSNSTGKGTHVTSTRDLFRLPNGSLIIDTPGMREFGIALDEGLQSEGLFPAIDKLAQNCRYDDCTHLGEEGCAVTAAYETGALDSAVYNSYVKLVKEQKRFEIKAEDRKRLGKQFGKMIREAKEYRNKYKY